MKLEDAIYHFSYGVNCDIFKEPVTTYAKMAISALEKQIPKKLIYDECYCCPSCGKYHIIEKFRYCPDCGQALDWSDTE